MKLTSFLWLFFLIIPVRLSGFQDQDSVQQNSRFSFGIIPALAFDSDLGIKYGAVFNFFDFGESKAPPHYSQFLHLRLTNTTKGTLNIQALFETESLIRNSKVMAEVSYFIDRKLDFFGFNGTWSNYNKDFTLPASQLFKSESYYSHHRNLLRLRLDVQKNLGASRFRFLTGVTFNRFFVDVARDSGTFSDSKPSPERVQERTLYEQYIDNGIIKTSEAAGGKISLLTFGLIYDSRNDPCYCTDGKWFEAILVHSPAFLSDQKFTKFIVTYRQHFSILNDKITFSFRASSQQKLSGDIPFYVLPTYFDSRLSQEGIGGAYNLRGVMRNRIAADGFLTGNFEIKARILNFTLLKQKFAVSLALFYDNAFVTQSYRVNTDGLPQEEIDTLFNQGRQRLHHTFGPGLYLVFNQNNVITVNYGISPDKQLGSKGLYIGSSLLF